MIGCLHYGVTLIVLFSDIVKRMLAKGGYCVCRTSHFNTANVSALQQKNRHNENGGSSTRVSSKDDCEVALDV